MEQTFSLTVNGRQHGVVAEPDMSLLHVLRHQLGLKGARFGCGLGLCGACVVLVDGHPTASCDMPMWSADKRTIVTVEGLGGGESLHPVQEAFLAEQAAQCGYCVSGILVSAAALLAQTPRPDERAIAAALDRHLCRCGVHGRMVRAVVRASDHDAASPSGECVDSMSADREATTVNPVSRGER